jgi:hypothetical protein
LAGVILWAVWLQIIHTSIEKAALRQEKDFSFNLITSFSCQHCFVLMASATSAEVGVDDTMLEEFIHSDFLTQHIDLDKPCPEIYLCDSELSTWFNTVVYRPQIHDATLNDVFQPDLLAHAEHCSVNNIENLLLQPDQHAVGIFDARLDQDSPLLLSVPNFRASSGSTTEQSGFQQLHDYSLLQSFGHTAPLEHQDKASSTLIHLNSSSDGYSCQWFPDGPYHGPDCPDFLGSGAARRLSVDEPSEFPAISSSTSTLVPETQSESLFAPVPVSREPFYPPKKKIVAASGAQRLQSKTAHFEGADMQSTIATNSQKRMSTSKKRRQPSKGLKGVPEERCFTFSAFNEPLNCSPPKKRKKAEARSSSVCLRCRQQKIKASSRSCSSLVIWLMCL